MGELARDIGPGIAGVVATANDYGTPECIECPWGDAQLRLWRTAHRITTEADARTQLSDRAPDLERRVSRAYSFALEPGEYLLCANFNCKSIVVPNGRTLTVNIKARNGPTGLFIGTGAELHEDFGFEFYP